MDDALFLMILGSIDKYEYTLPLYPISIPTFTNSCTSAIQYLVCNEGCNIHTLSEAAICQLQKRQKQIKEKDTIIYDGLLFSEATIYMHDNSDDIKLQRYEKILYF